MKNLLLPIFLCITGTIFAQDLEIFVMNKDSAAMPYAYVLVNRKPVQITDDRGKAIIPKGSVMLNDTISISYLGAAPSHIIYNSAIQKSGRCFFLLQESVIMLGEAVVKDIDIKKLFKKSNSNIPQLNYNCIMTADFEASIRMPAKDYAVTGKLEVENEVWSRKFTYRSKGWFHHPLKFTTKNDTAGISKMLNVHTHFALNNILKALDYSRSYMLDEYNPSYCYLGEKKNKRIFRITYPENSRIGFPFHILLYIDKDTKLLTSAEILTIEKIAARNSNPYMMRISCDCMVYSHKKPLMNTVYLPVNLHYSFEIPSGRVIDIRITNPVIRKS